MRSRSSLHPRTAEGPLSRSGTGQGHLDGLPLSQGRPGGRPVQTATLGPPEAAAHCHGPLLLGTTRGVHAQFAACGSSFRWSQSRAQLKRRVLRGFLSGRPAGPGSHFGPTRPQNSQNDTAPPPLRSASRRGLTPRSTRGPTAGQQARAAPRCTMRRAGLPSHRWPRVTSNVRPHGQHRRGSLRLASLPEAKKARVTRGGTGPQGQPVYS